MDLHILRILETVVNSFPHDSISKPISRDRETTEIAESQSKHRQACHNQCEVIVLRYM